MTLHGLTIRPLAAALFSSLLALALTGCSSLVPATQKQLEAIDPVRQDVSALVLTLDLPAGVQPVPETTRLGVNFTVAGQPDRRVDAMLVLADPGALTETLPPPGAGRVYYFMGFSEADQKKLREAQSWARSAGGTAAAGGLTMAPHFCGTEPIDISKARFTVNVTLPGAVESAPLIRNEVLANVLALSGETALAPC